MTNVLAYFGFFVSIEEEKFNKIGTRSELDPLQLQKLLEDLPLHLVPFEEKKIVFSIFVHFIFKTKSQIIGYASLPRLG